MPHNLIRRLALLYAVLFFIVGSLRYIPFINDANGVTLGIFSLQWWDDALHYGSGIWALIAAFYSFRASTLYFKIFGVMYALDGFMGFFLGQGYLDGGIFIYGPTPLDWSLKFAANLPHMVVGSMAIFIGYYLSREFPERVAKPAKA
jgi:hypothetical protein